MSRVKLNLPEVFDFSIEIPIRIDDLNYGAHLSHDSILRFAHESRVRYLRQLGYDEGDIEGFSYIMADAAIIYKSQAFYPQTLVIEVSVQDFTRNGFDFVYRMSEKQTGNQVALLKTGMVFYDYRKSKIVRVPEGFASRVTVEEE